MERDYLNCLKGVFWRHLHWPINVSLSRFHTNQNANPNRLNFHSCFVSKEKYKGNELNGVNNFWPQIWAHKHFSIAPGTIYRTTTSGKEEWKRDHGWTAGGSKHPLNSNPLFQALLLVQSYHLNQLSLSTLCCPISAQLSKDLCICAMISNAQ